MSHYELLIIGAGAAGLAASEAAQQKNIHHIILEASHRIGGRGLTEYLRLDDSGQSCAVDLGCHWMHSASLNPYVEWADKFGFQYDRHGPRDKTLNSFEADLFPERMYFDGNWLGRDKHIQWQDCLNEFDVQLRLQMRKSGPASLWDVMDNTRYANDEVKAAHAYWLSLMHSNDPDQVCFEDMLNYQDTEEDWPLLEGYGALIARQGEACPVSLNTSVRCVDWQGKKIRIDTNKGTMTADKVIITVSTGVLNSGDIQFVPKLPESKREAIDALPMGNYNNLFFALDDFDSDLPSSVFYQNSGQTLAINIQPFSQSYLFACVAGRFAWWLEKQGSEATEYYLKQALADIFGSEFTSRLSHFKTSAWGFDPWVKGAYSSAAPGKFDARRMLAQPINEQIYFAGEATSTDALNTAHGAYLSGKAALVSAWS